MNWIEFKIELVQRGWSHHLSKKINLRNNKEVKSQEYLRNKRLLKFIQNLNGQIEELLYHSEEVLNCYGEDSILLKELYLHGFIEEVEYPIIKN